MNRHTEDQVDRWMTRLLLLVACGLIASIWYHAIRTMDPQPPMEPAPPAVEGPHP